MNIIETLNAAGQQELAQHLESLTGDARANLERDILSQDWQELKVLHAEKELSGGSIEIEETEGVDSEKTELTSLYQYNINEKYVWAVKKKG